MRNKSWRRPSCAFRLRRPNRKDSRLWLPNTRATASASPPTIRRPSTRCEQSLARAREEAALDIEQSGQALAESRLELAQALAEQTRIAARVEEQTREQDLMRAEHQRALLDLEDQQGAALAELRSQLAQTSAEQARLAARVEAAEGELALQRAEHERAHDGLLAEHQRALADVQSGKRDELEALERRLQAATAEHGAPPGSRRGRRGQPRAHRCRPSGGGRHAAAVAGPCGAKTRRSRSSSRARRWPNRDWSWCRRSPNRAASPRVSRSRRANRNLMRAEHERAHDRLIAEHRSGSGRRRRPTSATNWRSSSSACQAATAEQGRLAGSR